LHVIGIFWDVSLTIFKLSDLRLINLLSIKPFLGDNDGFLLNRA